MTSDVRVTARIERHTDGTRIHEYEAAGEAYGSLDALQAALEGRE